jgi:hypothetical protein
MGAMIYELASAGAGFVMILAVQFVLCDALGLLGRPFCKTRAIINRLINLPDKFAHYLSATTHHYFHAIGDSLAAHRKH